MAASELQIRDAVEADLARLQPFAMRTWIEAFAHSFDDLEEAQRHVASELSIEALRSALANDAILIALAGNSLVGYGQLGRPQWNDLPTQSGDLQLRRLYVEPGRLGGGVGGQLLNATFARAKEQAAGSLWLEVWEHNPRAQRLYRRYGFETIAARRYFHSDGTPLDFDYIMRARVRR